MVAMSLTTCRECQGQVSHNAATCPHCGTDRPGYSPSGRVANEIGRLAIAVFIILFMLGGCLMLF